MSSKAPYHNHWPIQTHIYWRDNFQVKETKILGWLMDATIKESKVGYIKNLNTCF